MNTDKIFQTKKERMLLLLTWGMPSIVIEKVLAISQDTVRAYAKKLGTEHLPTKEAAKPQMLKIYANMHHDAFEYGDGAFRQALRVVLAEVLEEQRILQMLEYAIQGIYAFSAIRYADDVPEGYRRLINQVYWHPSCQSPRTVWERYLKRLSADQVSLTSDQFCWEKGKHFVQTIINEEVEDMRADVAPLLTHRICDIIDTYGIHPVIKQYHGIECAPKTFAEIATERGQSPERIRQIYASAFRELKGYLKEKIFPIGNAWDRIHQMEKTHTAEIDRIKELAAEKKYQDIIKLNPILLKNIKEAHFSTQVSNCLKFADINYVWQLLICEEDALWKIRNIGKRSMIEIKEFLEANGLKLGVKFTPAEVAYLQSN